MQHAVQAVRDHIQTLEMLGNVVICDQHVLVSVDTWHETARVFRPHELGRAAGNLQDRAAELDREAREAMEMMHNPTLAHDLWRQSHAIDAMAKALYL
jgi:hypothetical protein